MSRYKIKMVTGSPLQKVSEIAKDSIIRPILRLSAKELALMKRKSGLKGNVSQRQIVQGYLKACLNEC
jgi:hypothetical protein